MVIDYAMQFHPEMTLTTNPARDAKAPQATKLEADDEADQRWFDADEVQQFFKAVHAIERNNADAPTPVHVGAASWAIQYHLGLRPGEVRALSWSRPLKTPPTLRPSISGMARERSRRHDDR